MILAKFSLQLFKQQNLSGWASRELRGVGLKSQHITPICNSQSQHKHPKCLCNCLEYNMQKEIIEKCHSKRGAI